MQQVIGILLISIFFSLILTINNECSAQRATINVVVNSRQPIPTGQIIYAEGNFSTHNPFYQDKIPLIQSGDGSFIYSFILPQGSEVEFSFTRGFEGSHEVDGNKQIISKRKLQALLPFQTQRFTIEKWNDLTSKPYQSPIIVEAEEKLDLPESDRLRVHSELKGEGLSSRDVYVWLPPNYHIDTYKKYPVIYIHQNHAIFNPNLGDYNKDWKIDEIADEMANNSSNKGYILVSIDNRNDRSFAVGDASVINPYSKFVSHTIKPLIDSNYRTSTKPSENINIGTGVGGSISLVLSAQYGHKFGNAICIAPIIYFPEDYLHLATFINKYSSNKSNFIIESGSSKYESRFKAGAKSIHNHLLKNGFNTLFLTETSGEYAVINWEQRIRNLLLQLSF